MKGFVTNLLNSTAFWLFLALAFIVLGLGLHVVHINDATEMYRIIQVHQ